MFKPIKEKVSERLVLVRKELNLTIEEMGKLFGQSKGTFNSYLRAKAIPDDKILDQICEMVNVDKFWILYGKTEDFLVDYLHEYKIENMIKDNPELLNTMVLEFDSQYLAYQEKRKPNFSEQVDIKFKIANTVIKIHYELQMKKLIKSLLIKEIKDCQNHFSELFRENISEDWVIENILDEINSGLPKPKYGENEKIKELGLKKIGTMVFGNLAANGVQLERTIVMLDLLEITIRQFSSEEGIYEVLKFISESYGIIINKDGEQYKKIVEILKNNVGDLMDI